MLIYSHNFHSEGAKNLGDVLNAKRIKHENSKFIGATRKKVINWGASRLPDEVMKCTVFNKPEAVRVASNKFEFFRKVTETDASLVPDWTDNLNKALEWVGEGSVVVARTILNGHSGAGIVLMEKDKPDSFVRAPLYVKYIPKKEEYRIHVVRDQVIDYQRKTLSKEKADSGTEINWKIRNLDNGFIYQRGGVNPPESLLTIAKKTLEIVGLDFGAVDIVFNTKQTKGYALEVNTAPGITGTTVDSYARALGALK